MEARINHWQAAPELMNAVLGFSNAVESCGLEKNLMHLIKLRASQLNGCAFCVDMHTREARQSGETEQRLHLVSVWHDSFLFTGRERAALAWTEAVTRLGDHAPDDDLFAATQAEFPGDEIVKLTAVITIINTWNRFAVSFRALHAKPAPAAA